VTSGDGRGAAAWLARLVRATRVVDRGYRQFDRLRSRMVLAFASERVLRGYNDLAYGRSDCYLVRANEASLLPWEEQALERFFPPPPAHILVGGAGSGREAVVLVQRGYRVLAFEPSAPMVRLMVRSAGALGGALQAFRAAYEDLPRLAPGDGGPPVDLSRFQAFDAALLGLSSFSHLVTDAERLRALQQVAGVTRGPIVVSFFLQPGPTAVSPHGTRPPPGRIRRAIAEWLPATGDDAFSVEIGYFHTFSRDEFEALAGRASLRVVHFDADGNWNHAVLAG
jgi:SAM-dependent methyltransferase